MSPELTEKPIFLLGVGRCGSTFQQTWLNRTGQVWIWGEHDGLIGKFLAWGQEMRSNQNLRSFSYPNVDKDLMALIDDDLAADATHVAWLNGFNAQDILRIERAAITSLFRTRLPMVNLRWGFKEIRYGGRVRVAEKLLQLFPHGQIVHTLRSPFATVESSIAAWNRSELITALESSEFTRVEELYQQHLDRWQITTAYFLNLESQHPEQVLTSKLETFGANISTLCSFLGLPVSEGVAPSLAPVNANKGKSAVRSDELFHQLRQKFAPIVAETAAKAGYPV